MLEFTLSSRPFLLDESSSVRITRTNPACFTDSMPGDVALGISIPVNDNNRAMLGNPERFEKYSAATSREFPGFEIRYSGVLLALGTLIVQTANKESYSGWLRSELGNFGKQQREKKLTDMDWPTAQTQVLKENYDDDTDHYQFPIIQNNGFWDGIGREESTTETVIDENGKPVTREFTRSVLQTAHLKNYVGMVNSDAQASAFIEGAVVSPYLHLRYVIKEALRMNKWFIRRNDMLANEGIFPNFTKNAMVYNNFNIVDMVRSVYPEYTYTYSWNYEINDWEVTEVIYKIYTGWERKPFNYADLLPKVSMKDFLIGIQNSLNYIFFFKTDSTVDIIDRNSILKGASIDLSKYIVGDFEPGEQKNVRLKFLPEYDKNDNLFGSGFEDLSDRWADYKEQVATKADLDLIAEPEFGELRLVVEENSIYEYAWLVIEQENANRQEEQIDTIGWKFLSTGPQPYVDGNADEEEEIKTEVSTLQQKPGYWFSLFTASQKGNLASIRSSYSDFSLRIFSNMFFYSQRFFWEGEQGLFQLRWKIWSNFWKTRLPIEAEFDLPLNVLAYAGDNICGKFRTEKGEFIIEEMETNFGLNTIGTTRIKGYKV